MAVKLTLVEGIYTSDTGDLEKLEGEKFTCIDRGLSRIPCLQTISTAFFVRLASVSLCFFDVRGLFVLWGVHLREFRAEPGMGKVKSHSEGER